MATYCCQKTIIPTYYFGPMPWKLLAASLTSVWSLKTDTQRLSVGNSSLLSIKLRRRLVFQRLLMHEFYLGYCSLFVNEDSFPLLANAPITIASHHRPLFCLVLTAANTDITLLVVFLVLCIANRVNLVSMLEQRLVYLSPW